MAVTTVFLSSGVIQPDEKVHELSLESSPSAEGTPLMADPLTERLLKHQRLDSETEESFAPIPPDQDPPRERYVESFTEEENALLNSDEPTLVEVDSFTGDIISVEKRDHSIPVAFR
ncbi:hypothetical protein [Yaniella flava]